MKNLRHIFTLFLLLATLRTYAAFRENVLFVAQMDGAQMVPAIQSYARGIGSVMLNKKRDTLSINISAVGLQPTFVGLYVGSEGANGTLLFDLSDAIYGRSVLKRIGGAEVKTKVAKLMGDQLYLVIGTADNPAGELRGQVKLATDGHFVADLKGGEVVPAQANAAYGLGSFRLSWNKDQLDFKIICQKLSGAITNVSLHAGALGTVGAEVQNLTASVKNNVIVGSFVPSAELLNRLLLGEVYLNIATAARPNGEIRSQLRWQKGLTMESFSDGAQMVPPVQTNGKAIGIYRYNLAMDSFFYDIVMDNIATSIDYMHLHVGYAGQAYTGLQVDFTPAIAGNRARGAIKGLPSISSTRLLTGNLTLITHSAAHPQGEIRGHVERFAHEGYTIQLNGGQQVPAVGSNGYGAGFVFINAAQDRAYYNWLAGDLNGLPTGAQFQNAAAGQNGAAIHDMSRFMQVSGNNAWASGVWKSTDAVPFTILNTGQFDQNKVCLNLFSATNPEGELRGQVRAGMVYYTSTSGADDLFAGNKIALRLGPNPVHSILQIQMDAVFAKNLTVKLIDVFGKTVQREETGAVSGDLQTQLDVAALDSGVYFLTITDGKSVVSRKVVKW